MTATGNEYEQDPNLNMGDQDPHLETNPYYTLHIGDLTPASSNSSLSTGPRPIPPQESDTTDDHRLEWLQSSPGNELQAQVKLGLTALEAKKQSLERSLAHQIQQAKGKLDGQATTHYDKFVQMSRNNMTQYTEKATTLMKNMYQEQQTSTTALQQSLETTLGKIQTTKEQAFETTCEDLLNQTDQRHQVKVDAAIQKVDVEINKHTMQLRLDANDIEHRLNTLQDELADKAQTILNQKCPKTWRSSNKNF
jgi:hypothetical protein